MERFVFVTAVTVAIIFGVVAMFGGANWHVNWDEADAHGVAPMVEVASGRLEPQVYAGGDVRVRYAAARISVVPEDRQDISIEIDNPGSTPMPTVSIEDEHVLIDGQLRGRIEDCRDDGVELRGYGFVSTEQMPRITIRTPRRLEIGVGGASRTEIGATDELNADFSGCGAATIADVTETMTIDLSGSGQVNAGAAHSLKTDVAGSGDIVVGAIADGADVSIAGSGTVTIGSLTGALDASSAGSGALTVNSGAVTTADVSLAGSGDVNITASVTNLEASIVGSGDVDVNGQVGDIDAEIAGSGGVSASSVTGNVRKQIMGSGDVTIGG
jgi:hypothetical protein